MRGSILIVTLILAACSTPAPLDTSSSATSALPPTESSIVAAEFEPPVLTPSDPGVVVAVEVPAPDVTWDEILTGLVEAGPTDEAVEVELESCLEVGPQYWRVDGSATVPAGIESPTVLFQFVMRNDDMVESIPVLVELGESGRFAFVADFLTRSLREGEFFWPANGYTPGREGCLVEVTHGSVATRSGSWTIPAEGSSEPITWPAPEGSIQALGLGASMSDRADPRISWMALAWLDIGPGLDTVWVPTDPLLPVRRMSWSGACDSMTLGDDRSVAVVELLHRCDLTYLVNADSAANADTPEVEGFQQVAWADLPALQTTRDGWTIVIHSGSVETDWQGIERVARSLTFFRNLVVQERDVPGVGGSADEAISEFLEFRGLTARGRRVLRPGLITILAVGEDLGEHVGDIPGTFVANFETVLRDDVWVVDGYGYSGGGDLCLTGIGTSHEAPPEEFYYAMVAAEPAWTIQQATDDGSWETLDTESGIAWVPDLKRVAYRAIDANGDPVYCSAGALGKGETWSPWQLPHARWDLDLVATPDQSPSDGDTVRIEGSGFPKNANVDISICRVSDPNRPDIAQCQPFEESEERYGRTDPDGSLDRTYTATAHFTDDYGQEVDCTRDRCVIQVSTNAGYLRVGQAPISFGG
jgi:hypothetical protein